MCVCVCSVIICSLPEYKVAITPRMPQLVGRTHSHTHTHSHSHVECLSLIGHTHIHTHTCIHTHKMPQLVGHTHSHTHTHTHTHTHARRMPLTRWPHTPTHTYTQMHTHEHRMPLTRWSHTHTHTHTHSHKRIHTRKMPSFVGHFRKIVLQRVAVCCKCLVAYCRVLQMPGLVGCLPRILGQCSTPVKDW